MRAIGMSSRHSRYDRQTRGQCTGLALVLLWLLPALPLGRSVGTQTREGQDQHAATRVGSRDPELARAKSLLDRGMPDDAERLVWQYLQGHPHSGGAHFLLGYILFREIQAKAVLDAHSASAVYQAPGESEVKFRDTNAKASLAEYTAGAKYQRPSAFDLKIVALDYVLLGDYVDADKWLTRSLQWNPKDSEGWYYLGRAKYSENRFAEAVAAFKHCLRLDEKNAKAEDNLGLSYAGLGRNDEAAAAYETAIAWQSGSLTKDPEPFIDLGSLYLDLNQPDKAIPFLLQSIQISSQISRAHEQLGRAYLLVNQLPKAQNQLEKAVALSPQTARLHYILGQIYRKRGLTAKAKVEFDRCVALQRSHPTDSSTM
jgi:tetratricopeptide (TPR) repeat protein